MQSTRGPPPNKCGDRAGACRPAQPRTPLSTRRPFPAAGVEVFLEVEDLWVSGDPTDTVTLGSARFVPAGSVRVGSYSYDDPVKDHDPRVLPLGEVPRIVYSEVVSDLEALVQRRAD